MHTCDATSGARKRLGQRLGRLKRLALADCRVALPRHGISTGSRANPVADGMAAATATAEAAAGSNELLFDASAWKMTNC